MTARWDPVHDIEPCTTGLARHVDDGDQVSIRRAELAISIWCRFLAQRALVDRMRRQAGLFGVPRESS